jgi:multidrug efflux system membrane fusion protein
VGETVAGTIIVAVHHNAVVVPISALVPGDTGFVVFTVDAASIAHATPVTVGGRTETEAEILSGLRGGEMIVTEGAYGVTDGARIQRGPPR